MAGSIERQMTVPVFTHPELDGHEEVAFGHDRDTTPNLDRFLAERPERTAAFHRAYGNSTRTMIAVPSFLTGISFPSGC